MPVNFSNFTGNGNDLMQQARHNYAGPEWEKYLAFLNSADRLAPQAPGRTSLGALGRPGDADSARSIAANLAIGEQLDARAPRAASLRALTAGADIAEAQARQVQGAEQDQEALDRALQTGGRPAAPIVQQPGGGYVAAPDPNAPPTTSAEQRANVLKMVPGHVGLMLQKEWAVKDADAAKAQLERDKLTEVQRKDRATEKAAAPFVPPTDATGAPVMGEALLKTLPDAKQKLVTAILEGRQALPSGAALKDPYWKGIIETANAIDPNFDTVNFNARANTRKDFTSGKAAGQINAINTVVGHLHDLADTGEKLGNFGLNWMNKIYNAITPGGTNRGVALNNFETLKEGVSTELMRTWRQVGAGSEKEIEDWKAQLEATKSPEELRGAFKTIGGMLESKLNALDSQYKQGMGTDKISAITPESRAKLDALQGVKAGAPAASGPTDGARQPIPGGGGIAEFRGGKWIRVE